MRGLKRRQDWPGWRYSPDGQSKALFVREEDVPLGWVRRREIGIDTPYEIRVPVRLDREALLAALDAKGIHLIGSESSAHLKHLLDETE